MSFDSDRDLCSQVIRCVILQTPHFSFEEIGTSDWERFSSRDFLSILRHSTAEHKKNSSKNSFFIFRTPSVKKKFPKFKKKVQDSSVKKSFHQLIGTLGVFSFYFPLCLYIVGFPRFFGHWRIFEDMFPPVLKNSKKIFFFQKFFQEKNRSICLGVKWSFEKKKSSSSIFHSKILWFI